MNVIVFSKQSISMLWSSVRTIQETLVLVHLETLSEKRQQINLSETKFLIPHPYVIVCYYSTFSEFVKCYSSSCMSQPPFVFSHHCLSTELHFDVKQLCLTLICLVGPADTCWMMSLCVFSGQLLPNVFKSHAWGILHTLLEMFSYRMHHIQPHYRVQLLSHLHSLAAVPQTNQNQLHLW